MAGKSRITAVGEQRMGMQALARSRDRGEADRRRAIGAFSCHASAFLGARQPSWTPETYLQATAESQRHFSLVKALPYAL